jgi:hypothetical protein
MRASLKSFRSLSAAGALSVIAALSACSLEQRGSSNTVQLTLQRKADAASKLAGGVAAATGVSAVSSNIYFMITVSGEGMILAPFKGAGCLGVTVPSTVFVPASVTGKQGVDLEVLVGRNRLVRLYQIEFASGVPLPNSGEAFHRYMDRTRNAGAADGRVVGEPWLLATAFIPNLQGDQTVTLIEKASPERMFCPGGGSGGGGAAPPLYDAYNNAEMSNYSHWEGGTAANPNPIRIWSWSGASTAPYSTPDFRLRMEGAVKNLYPSASTSNVLSISTTTPNITKVSGYFYGASSGAPVAGVTSSSALINWGGVSQAPYQQSLYFRQLAMIPGTLLTPSASWYGGQLRAKHELKFSITTGATPLSGAINREIPIQRVSGNPITVDSLVKVNGAPVSYQNLYKLKITNALGSSIRLMPYFSRSLFTDKQWSQTNGFADVEIIKAPAVISTPNECPFQESGSSLSEAKILASGAHCYLYIAIFHPGNLTATEASQEKLFLESRVRDSSENEGYLQHPVQPSGGFNSVNDGAINSFRRTGAVYSEASTNLDYSFNPSNTYGPNTQYFNVSSANLVYAELFLEGNKMIRAKASDVTLPSSFSGDSIDLRRKYNGDRVLEAVIVIEGQMPTGSRAVQRMRVPFYPASSLILFAEHAPVAGGAPFSIPSGQKIWFNCPGSTGSFTYNYTTRFKLGAAVVDAPLYPTNLASQTFTSTLSFSGASKVLSPSAVSGTYTYLNIDGSPNTQGGGWQFECL